MVMYVCERRKNQFNTTYLTLSFSIVAVVVFLLCIVCLRVCLCLCVYVSEPVVDISKISVGVVR